MLVVPVGNVWMLECPVCFSRALCPPCLGSGVVAVQGVGLVESEWRLFPCSACCGTGLSHDIGMHVTRSGGA